MTQKDHRHLITNYLSAYYYRFTYHLREVREEHVIYQGNHHRPIVALTFDDGPDPNYTPQILSILQQEKVQATFFCIGRQVQRYPHLAKSIVDAGHTIANHSWTHPHLTTLLDENILRELSNTSQAIKQATGISPHFFRPPYGDFNTSIRKQAIQLGLTTIFWSLDTGDWYETESSSIVKRVVTRVKNGAIILMHDGGNNRLQTIDALPVIIATLKQRNFLFVTIQELVDTKKRK